MSDDPLLNKMDALLKKHRGAGEPAHPGPPEVAPASERPPAWLPVLTDVIERGTPPAIQAAPLPQPPAPAAESDAPLAPAVSDTLAEQLMSELAPRLSEVMEKQVAAELRRNIDETVANLLSQLDVNMREVVRDAVAEKLKQPRKPSS
ncbi:MAG: hypothetical protein ACYC5S_05590 [Thiobacillus sp.]